MGTQGGAYPGHLWRKRTGLVEALIVALSAGAVVRGLSSAIGKGLLVMALGCIGPLLAVFGQTYQTGADVWQLFASWAALGLIWAVAARSGAACLVWVVIAQTALCCSFGSLPRSS
jgi:uncharacterized membrane protein